MRDIEIKKQLARHIAGGEAFLTVDEMLKEIPFSQLGIRPKELPYSFYELFYHMQFAQKDILEYCIATKYQPHKWPQDYWPLKSAPASTKEWEDLVLSFKSERERFQKLVLDPETMLTKKLKKDTDHTLMREILLVIEHNAYHTGQLLIVLRSLGLHHS
ncbi:DinB family protein [Gillisia sp. M10.2A]|uniref:DinB family protein n=1 Tax=Gillisia lutea TaxID=2909668 RepID=A0ABS9EED9_9FLAO|nr:DinB family protein [Gillisia lutea]MCF4101247.1 DinB family protein [Gillisia lutea]